MPQSLTPPSVDGGAGLQPQGSVLDYPSRLGISTVLRHMTVQGRVVVDSQDLAGSRSRQERHHDATK